MERGRETLGSRLGFLFLSAGCAIGLGNVWRFPFIAGKYGGAAFVFMYLVFLVIFGLPIMAAEFSVGRASRRSVAQSFKVLEPAGTKWHLFGYFGVAGNYLLMMFYTTVAGWMVYYFFATASGKLAGLTPDQVVGFFGGAVSNPGLQIFWMIVVVLIGFTACFFGLQNGVEKITKFMMSGLLAILVILVFRAVTLPGAEEGLSFYLKPDFGNMVKSGLWEAVYAAFGQAFFTLSIGMGNMAIFGSYIDKSRSLTGECVNIIGLDTFAALMAGLIIFPSCFSFGVNPGAGPGLIFVTLPNIFNQLAGGTFWGALFFLFMSFAALTTVVAVFENIAAFMMERGISRKKSVIINVVLVILLSIPCVLGFNVWSGFQPLGPGTNVLDLEDFFVSNNLLPVGSLIYLAFCCTRYGWGWDNFIAEVDTGKGLKFPKNKAMRFYLTYVVPVFILIILAAGYWEKFAPLILGK